MDRLSSAGLGEVEAGGLEEKPSAISFGFEVETYAGVYGFAPDRP